jgi:integrase
MRTGDALFLRGKVWYLDFRHDGARHVFKLGKGITRHVAAELASVKRTQMLRHEAGIGPKQRKDILFDDARDEFLKWVETNRKAHTVRCYRQFLAALTTSFQGKPLSQICRLDIERHKRTRVDTGAKVRPNREISVLKNLYNRCKEWGLYEGENPAVGVKLLKEPQQRLRYLECDEEVRLLQHCTEPLKSLLVIAINTGVRIESEALSLTWHDVDLRRRLLTIPAAYAKSGKTRTIPLNSRAVAALESLRETAQGEYVFADANGERYYWMLDKPFAAALKKVGLDGTGITPHTCRHTFASRLVMSGADLRSVQELGGWSDLKLVMRYAHLAPGHKPQAVEKIAAGFHDAIHDITPAMDRQEASNYAKLFKRPRSSVV